MSSQRVRVVEGGRSMISAAFRRGMGMKPAILSSLNPIRVNWESDHSRSRSEACRHTCASSIRTDAALSAN
jgi:hypothetical protein